MNLTRDDGEPTRAVTAQVTHDLISLLGVTPRLGRSIQACEDLAQGMGLAAAGLVIGLAGSGIVSGWLKSLLYGVSAFDLVTYILVAGALLAAILVACAFPARKPTGVDPAVALRAD